MARKVNPKSLENLKKRKPFVKGDPRINRMGRASNFDELRKLFQEIANEETEEGVTRIRKIGELLSADKKTMKDFLEYGYGKVPQNVDVTSKGEAITQQVDDERFDRAVSSLADAIRESISGKSTDKDGKVDTPK